MFGISANLSIEINKYIADNGGVTNKFEIINK